MKRAEALRVVALAKKAWHGDPQIEVCVVSGQLGDGKFSKLPHGHRIVQVAH
jgi:hypothetical protein